MKLRWFRLILTAVAVEVAAILALVILVALFGPKDPAAAQAFAPRLGAWVGPIGGALFTFLAAWWLARRVDVGAVAHGIALGALVALIDIALLVASGAEFQWLFVASNAAKIAAGALGGWLAKRSRDLQIQSQESRPAR